MFTLKRLILVLQLRITNLLRTPSPCLTTQNLRLTSTFSHLIHYYLHSYMPYQSTLLNPILAPNCTTSENQCPPLYYTDLISCKTAAYQPKERQESNHKGYDDNQNEQDNNTPNNNHNEFKNNPNDFPKLDNLLNAQLYSVSKNLVVKRNV